MGDDLVKLMIDDKLDDFNKRRNQKWNRLFKKYEEL